MAACGSLQHMFEKPLPESPKTLLESFSSSWNHQINNPTSSANIKPIDPSSSLAEIFGELHFKENNSHRPFPNIPSSPFSLNPQKTTFRGNDENNNTPKQIIKNNNNNNNCHKKSASFALNSESLQLCTEGLGFESSCDVEEMKKEEWESKDEKTISAKEKMMLRRRRACSLGAFPPPISCIGKSGKPGVSFKSYRQDGRFVLKEVRIPTQEFLRACREDGRLRLQFVQPNDEFLEDDQEEEREEEEQGISSDVNIGEGKENRQA